MLEVSRLSKLYKAPDGDVQALSDVNVSVGVGEIVTVLGPSGCGKSTMLRCIAALEKPDAGEIEINGQVVFSGTLGIRVPTFRLPIGMVFQSYAIWPHMTVFDNVAYPLRVSRKQLSRHETSQRVERVLEMTRISDLADRSATLLSGGQQQRVALARALVREPKLLLLDEPLSNLDATLRDEMRRELKELFTKTGSSALYVTHDHADALSLSKRILVMNAGKVVQEGTPRELFDQPRSTFVADFLGVNNVLPATVLNISGQSIELDLGFARFTCPSVEGAFSGGTVLVAIRPESLSLTRNIPPDGSTLPACRVVAELFLGTSIEYQVILYGSLLRVRMALGAEKFAPGEQAYLTVPYRGFVVVCASPN